MPLMLKEDAAGRIYTGTRGQYHWLTSIGQHMGAVVQFCPDVVLGRYLAVAATDGGVPSLTDAQRAAGWQLRSGIAYSQRVSTIDELFYQRDGNDCPGYDEWYLFDTPPQQLGEIISGNPLIEDNKPRPGRLVVLVGWVGSFVLHGTHAASQTINEMFWQQLDWIRPDVYVSDGRDNLTFVCQNLPLFESVRERLGAATKP
jgi:hypothetical protein